MQDIIILTYGAWRVVLSVSFGLIVETQDGNGHWLAEIINSGTIGY